MADSDPDPVHTHETRMLAYNPKRGYVHRDYALILGRRLAFKADGDWQPVTTAEADRLRDVEARSERSPLIFEVRRIPGAPEPDGDAGEQQGDDDGWPDDAAPATPPGAAKPEPEPPKPKPKRRSRSRAKPAAKK